MTPAQFITKWGDSRLRERQGAQEHFIDLCRLLGQPTPAEDDPLGERYCFERGAAVAAAYGWPADLADEQVLERLFALNQERAAAGR